MYRQVLLHMSSTKLHSFHTVLYHLLYLIEGLQIYIEKEKPCQNCNFHVDLNFYSFRQVIAGANLLASQSK